jgi:AraC-like DNA-binding protein
VPPHDTEPYRLVNARCRRGGGATVHFTRASSLLPFVHFLNDIGAPTDAILGQARIPPDLLEDPEALVPLSLGYRFLELAARRTGAPDLGVVVADRASPLEFGAFGAALRSAASIGEYLLAGIGRVNEFTSGERFWLQDEGAVLRLCQFLPGPHGLGRSVADAYTLALTIGTLQRSAAHWQPRELGLLAGTESGIGRDRFDGETKVVTGQSWSSLVVERALLREPLANGGTLRAAPGASLSEAPPPMPAGFVAGIEQLVQALLPGGYPDLRLVSEVAGMSPRTLQRRLAERGLSYSTIVSRCRTTLAMRWLGLSDLRVTDIAARLGYTDASNFSRAFRARLGVSPQAFREGGAPSGRQLG